MPRPYSPDAPSYSEEEECFRYSPEHPPSLDVLRARLFAVHATDIFPKEGIMKAGASLVHLSGGSSLNPDEEPPSFRPTIHFSLGELVRGHERGNWETKKFAVILPLWALEEQLINIFPHDTFVLGDVVLPPGTTILVPSGTRPLVSLEGVMLKEYGPEESLRSSVDRVISEIHGWKVDMREKDVSIGSIANVNGVEISRPEFFHALFTAYPDLSFGTHIASERGEAFRFGLIDDIIRAVTASYVGNGYTYTTKTIAFFQAQIRFHLEHLEVWLSERSAITSTMRDVFIEKRRKLDGWMNILDRDIAIREKWGRTLAGANKRIRDTLSAFRNDRYLLAEYTIECKNSLPSVDRAHKVLETSFLVAFLSKIPPQEVARFEEMNEELFLGVCRPQLYANYAVARWLIIGEEGGVSEGLDELLRTSLSRIPDMSGHRMEEGIFGEFKSFLDKRSNRFPLALKIIKEPFIRKHLESSQKMHFNPDGPTNLEDILRAHPETRALFDVLERESVGEEEEILKKLGLLHWAKKRSLTSFVEAQRFSFESGIFMRREQEMREALFQPINSRRDMKKILVGESLGLYEILYREYPEPINLWVKFGLDQEFRRAFQGNHELFWRSEKSFMDIFRSLKHQKERCPD